MEDNESRLQKDFKSRDVQRMRNLITKNYGDKTATQAGYTKQSVEHKEGDIWEENGKTEKSSTSVQCAGTTKKGKRCKRMTLSSNGRCHQH